MVAALNQRTPVLPWKDPLQASIPQIRDGFMAAVYYGQRCSGDFYDFLRVAPARVLFGLFDVAGDLQRTRGIVVAIQEKFRSLGASLLGDDKIADRTGRKAASTSSPTCSINTTRPRARSLAISYFSLNALSRRARSCAGSNSAEAPFPFVGSAGS